MEARRGRDAAGGSMQHDSATGHVSWPGTRMQSWKVDLLWWTNSLCGIGIADPGAAGSAASRRQASRGGG
ncbi:hypothetical protein J4732_14030 [Serratia marcescens]|uniref:Uncharacterized protein n=1 Tax=Serratia marcescens TaxID=615 RepID=A0A939NK59_SERMA|nr:hypothetical protein [Serratia marcescens]